MGTHVAELLIWSNLVPIFVICLGSYVSSACLPCYTVNVCLLGCEKSFIVDSHCQSRAYNKSTESGAYWCWAGLDNRLRPGD